jgi:hypothetical protein
MIMSEAFMEVTFTHRGRSFTKKKEDFIKATKGLAPGRIQKYSVNVNNVEFPIRQLVSAATGIPTIEITSQDAYRILQKFDFHIKIDE